MSNMMSLRENDSLGMLGFGNEMNLSRRESSIRKDSYQMNKLGQNRQSLDLFSIQKTLREVEIPTSPIAEMRKQISVGDFGKKTIENHFELIKIGSHEDECINLYEESPFKLPKTGSARAKIREKGPSESKPRKTFREKTGANKGILDFLKTRESGPKRREKKQNEMRTSLEELKEITKKQRPKLNPKLKDKLRINKKPKLKKAKTEQVETPRTGKRSEPERAGNRKPHEARHKVVKARKSAKLKSSLKKSFKKKGGARNTGKGNPRRPKPEEERICVEDKTENPNIGKKGLLDRRGIRESLKHIIEKEGTKK